MKNLIKYGFIAFVICFFSGCTTEGITEKEAERRKVEQYKKFELEYQIIVLDECQYYQQNYGIGGRGKLTHKGNCNNPIHNCR